MSVDDDDLDKALSDLSRTAEGQPNLDSLRSARLLLTSAGLARQVEAIKWRSHNQPGALAEFENRLLALKFSFRDLRAERAERHQQIGILIIGGGSTLVGGSVLAAATQVLAYPPLALFAIAAGGYAAWRGVIENRRLALEVSSLDDIIEALDSCMARLREKP